MSLGSIAGPSLGGIMVSTLGWEYIFWVNIPIGVIAILLGWKVLPKDLTRTKSTIDVPGSLLFAIFIISLFAGLLLGQQLGYGDSLIVTSLIVAVISFIAFLWTELRRKNRCCNCHYLRIHCFH